MNPGTRKVRGFTLIELLVVVAILCILVGIMLPVFANVREKERQSVCSSNLKQFIDAIIMYAQDADESLPFSVVGPAQIGPATAAASGLPEFGVHIEIMPYVKSTQAFVCPDDTGFTPPLGTQTCGGVACAGTTLEQAYGSSYRFAPENFSQFPASGAGIVNPPSTPYVFPASQTYQIVQTPDGLIGPPGGPYNMNPPFPMTLSFFQEPAVTRVMRCYRGYWEVPEDDPNNPMIFHPSGEMQAFMDGHVKWVNSEWQLQTYCDGPTWTPVRNLSPSNPNYKAGGDGSCSGYERDLQ